MTENGNQPKLSEIGNPILAQEKKTVKTVDPQNPSEEKYLRAKNIILSKLISANESQASNFEELRRAEEELQKNVVSLAQIQISIASMHEKIIDIFTTLNKKQDEIQTLSQLIQYLEVPISNISAEYIDKVIDHFEAGYRNNINISINKIINYDKYE